MEVHTLRWTCPHCQTQLATTAPRHARSWHYVRCSQCGGYAMVERATGRAMKVEATVGAETEPRKSAGGASRGLRRRIALLLSGAAALAAVANGLLRRGEPRVRVAATSTAAAPPAQAPALAEAPPAPALADFPLLASDTLHAAAMAPIRRAEPTTAQQATAPEAPPLNARLRHHALSDELRAGPGHDFPIVGKADPEQDYPVLEWRNKWFKVGAGAMTAWIHYDSLELLSSSQARPEPPATLAVPTAPLAHPAESRSHSKKGRR